MMNLDKVIYDLQSCSETAAVILQPKEKHTRMDRGPILESLS
jgi:hypothetical protein